jgi:methionyl-tRNA formyltransferase
MVDQVVIIGTGRLARACLEICLVQHRNVVCIEPEKQVFSSLSAACKGHGVDYCLLTDKLSLESFFLKIQIPTLVVSAYNSYLFSDSVLKNSNLCVVNFHNSLLPKHRGRNAPTWAIFELDAITGITWHRVTPNIDAGEIIAQRAIPISDFDTAVQLTQRTLDVGAEVFGEIVARLLNSGLSQTVNLDHVEGRIHRAKDVPNDGVLDLSWTPIKISAFLRSLDYGKFMVFTVPQVTFQGSTHEICGYFVERDEQMKESDLMSDGKNLKICGNGFKIEIVLR